MFVALDSNENRIYADEYDGKQTKDYPPIQIRSFIILGVCRNDA